MASLVESGMKNLNFGDADSRRVLPDARRDLEPGRVRGLPGQARAADEVVPGRRRAGQEGAGRGGQADRRPEQLRRVDRRRRAPGRAVPRPLPDQARRRPRACSPAARPRRRAPAAAAAAVVDAARGARAGGGGELARRRGARRRQDASAASARSGTNTGPKVDEYLAAAKVAPGQPVVRLVHHVVAGEGRAQDAGRRLGRRPDLGAQRRAGQQRPQDRQRRRTRGPATSSPTTGAARTTSAPTATSASSTAPSRTASSPRWRATTPTRSTPSTRSIGSAQHQLHPRRGQRPGRRRVPVRPAAPAGRRRRAAAPSTPIDPEQFGGEGAGTGGPPSAEALALLENKNVVLDDVGIKRHQGRPHRPARDRAC